MHVPKSSQAARGLSRHNRLLCLPLGLLAGAGVATAQAPSYTTFTGFTPGISVDAQGGWRATNPAWDETVVDLSGDLAWRVSNAVISGSFGDQPYAPGTDLYAGESGSMHDMDAAPAITDRFYASFDIWSVTGAAQPGLDITISPDDGAGKRQSFISIEDNGAGIDIDFFDTQGNHPTTNANGGFTLTTIATGLSYASTHNIAFDITFVDGNIIDGGGNVFGNDIVKIFVDGQLVHTGTTWESYWWTTTEGQVPPSLQAIDTLLFRLSTPGGAAHSGAGFYLDNVLISSKCPTECQDFEIDTEGWEVFSTPAFYATRVPSGTNGIPSATGAFHAVGGATEPGTVPATNWGGYGGNCGCASTSCAVTNFPPHGYSTSIDIYLDMAGGAADDTRFDFSSAINQPSGAHRRDFIFNAGFYSSVDPTVPGAGADRFIVSASNNSGQPPSNPSALPIAITTTGWYTFEHRFYNSGSNVLAVDMTILDTSGSVVGQWTRSDPSDIIGTTVAGNRYGWFPTIDFDSLAFDNSCRTTGGDAQLALTVEDCQDDASPSPGYQIEVELSMLELTSFASGYQAFVDYDMGTFSYRGDLSSYSAGPFPQHIGIIGQADDGLLELDGSVVPGGAGTDADSLLATLVFDVTGAALCVPLDAVVFEVGGTFGSELSFNGVALDTVLTDPPTYTLDDTPPMLSPCPVDIMQAADAGSSCTGAVVTFTDPTATDNCDSSPVVSCSPPSGSFFPLGVTPVTCTATDACGNESMCMFNVEVTATSQIEVEVQLVGNNAPVMRCIHFQTTEDCGATVDQTLSFVDHDGDDANMNGIVDATEGGSNTLSTPVRAMDIITVPCGTYTGLCAKDQQHTKWADAPSALSVSGGNYVAAGVISLDGGDTDNDGDVDINDVTFLLAQFGGVALPGGCPWDGVTRDSDFSNNGVVGAEDYSFLTANWLTLSECACMIPSTSGERVEKLALWRSADDVLGRAADLNKDGKVDVSDVELLERRHGLSGELSRRMRESR